MADKFLQPSHEPPYNAKGTLRPGCRLGSKRRKGSWLGEAMALNLPSPKAPYAHKVRGEKNGRYLKQLACPVQSHGGANTELESMHRAEVFPTSTNVDVPALGKGVML